MNGDNYRSAVRLDEAFALGGSWPRVRSLRFDAKPSWSDWLRGEGWALSTEAAE